MCDFKEQERQYSDVYFTEQHSILLRTELQVGREKKATRVSFHEIPAEYVLREAWFKAIDSDEWTPKYRFQLFKGVQQVF